jgi:hypothetical protein
MPCDVLPHTTLQTLDSTKVFKGSFGDYQLPVQGCTFLYWQVVPLDALDEKMRYSLTGLMGRNNLSRV